VTTYTILIVYKRGDTIMGATSGEVLLYCMIFLLVLGVLGLTIKLMMRPVFVAVAFAAVGWLLYLEAINKL